MSSMKARMLPVLITASGTEPGTRKLLKYPSNNITCFVLSLTQFYVFKYLWSFYFLSKVKRNTLNAYLCMLEHMCNWRQLLSMPLQFKLDILKDRANYPTSQLKSRYRNIFCLEIILYFKRQGRWRLPISKKYQAILKGEALILN